MSQTKPITEVISQRYSVRMYQNRPITEDIQTSLRSRLDAIHNGPLGTPLRINLVAALPGNNQIMRGLGTYGTIKSPTGFLVGAVANGEHALEDYGYAMEQAILETTALGLGSCWLGATYTQSSFAKKIGKGKHEIIPAVVSIGYAEENNRARDRSRQMARSDQRLLWETLFFDSRFNQPLSRENAGPYAEALEMVRIGPSASNKQPWRIVKDGRQWHFYCQRTPGYGKGSLLFTLIRIPDLQRLDVGIGMCHFELTARQGGLDGQWVITDPKLVSEDDRTVYVATWLEK